MTSITQAFRALQDPSRVRLILLLDQEELSVAELQDILGMGQSRISGHLAQLRKAGLVEDRRSGKHSIYRLRAPDQWPQLLDLTRKAGAETSDGAADLSSLNLILERRKDRTRAYFDELAGRFGRAYVPGRSWQGLSEALLTLLPPLDIADLGAGEGTFSLLLARRARRVIAVDSSEKMVNYARDLAQRNGVANVEFRLGDLESPPIEPMSMDVAFFSQSLHHAEHPQRAVAAAWHFLRSGGRIVILDLKRHHFEEAREAYADRWLGFSEVALSDFLITAGFANVAVSVVHRETEAPHLDTVLAGGTKI